MSVNNSSSLNSFFDQDFEEFEQDFQGYFEEYSGLGFESGSDGESNNVDSDVNNDVNSSSGQNYSAQDQTSDKKSAVDKPEYKSVDKSAYKTVIGQEMPYNLDAEQALLSALLHDNNVYEHVVEFLKAEHFYDPVNKKIYKTAIEFIEQGQIANPITISPSLTDSVEGVKKYLTELAAALVSITGAKTYAMQIYDNAVKRDLIRFGDQIMSQSYKSHMQKAAIDIIEDAEKTLFDLAVTGSTESSASVSFSNSLSNAITDAKVAFEKDSHVVGITTGLDEVDKCIGGLHNSDLIIVAGRPSMGKTAFAVNVSFNAAKAFLQKKKEGAKVAFFSLEMSAQQLAMRLLGQESGIPSDRIRRGAIGARDFERFAQINQELSQLPFFIDDTPALSVSALRTRARRLMRQEKIGCIVIDYLQLLTTGGRNANSDNRVQELSLITRSLKALAKELNIPVIAVSQLSRSVEQREDKHPQLSDLRESGTIEQDADIVMFIYREAYYVARSKPSDTSPKMDAWQQEMSRVHGKATLMIAKQRHGPVKNIMLHFNEALTKFGNLDDVETL